MSLYFRLIGIFLFSRFRSRVPSLGPCRTPFTCWPSDIDVLRHMNNGRYFTLMDLARVDLLQRSKMAGSVAKAGWYPVVVAETARFFKSIQPFTRFEIETVVIGWDEKAVLLKQTFHQNKKVMCEAVVRARFLKRAGGSVPVAELMDKLQVTDPQPALEPWIEKWNQSQQS